MGVIDNVDIQDRALHNAKYCSLHVGHDLPLSSSHDSRPGATLSQPVMS